MVGRLCDNEPGRLELTIVGGKQQRMETGDTICIQRYDLDS
jgi:hypothetical protein